MHQSVGKKNRISIYLIFLIILSTTSGKFLKDQKGYSLKIDKIEVVGLSKRKNFEILNQLNDIFYQNIFVIRKKEIHKVISNQNIVEQYNIKKIYPSRLYIDIKPTKFIAKVISNGNNLVLGENGKLISTNLNDKKLPYIFGEFDKNKFLEFKENVERSKFNFIEFETIYFFPSNRWDILTANDILIKLPSDNTFKSLNLAYKIISQDKFKNKKIIDLRINGHLIIENE